MTIFRAGKSAASRVYGTQLAGGGLDGGHEATASQQFQTLREQPVVESIPAASLAGQFGHQPDTDAADQRPLTAARDEVSEGLRHRIAQRHHGDDLG
jgi:hypothetical protein